MSLQEETKTFRQAFARRNQTIDEVACPSSEDLFDAASGALDTNSLNHIVDHVGECARCSESWRLAMEIAPPEQITTGSKRSLWVGLATAATIVVSAAVWMNMENTTGIFSTPAEINKPVFRGSEQSAGITNATPESLSTSALTLHWQSVQSWPSYSVIVMNAELDTLWSASDITASSVTVPVEALTKASPNELLFWQVEGWRDGVRQQTSPLFSFSVNPREK